MRAGARKIKKNIRFGEQEKIKKILHAGENF